MPFVTPHAPTVSEVGSCVQCGLCLPYCPTFRITGKETASPRGRIAAMAAVLDGTSEVDEVFDETISSCLGCRACEAVCPSLVPYGRIFGGAKAELTEQRSTAGRSLRRVVLGGLLPRRGLVRTATRVLGVLQRAGLFRFAPSRLRRPLTGLRPLRGRGVGLGAVSGATTALLAGCVAEPWFPAVHEAAVDLLTRAGHVVSVPAGQTCCGALAAHDGHEGAAERLAAVNVAAFAPFDLVVSTAAGCTAHLGEYRHLGEGGRSLSERVRDVTEVVADLIADGALPTLDVDRGPVAIQDPCHLRHAQRVVEAPRVILQAAGHRPVEIDPDGLCCGAAGIYSVLHPEESERLGGIKAQQVRGSGVRVVASANPGCEMQLRAHLGAGFRIAHPIELYRQALMDAEGT
jgi:glycolate oxidase iron-sulfur subunit